MNRIIQSDEKLKIVIEILKDEASAKSICEKYGIETTLAKEWVQAFLHSGKSSLVTIDVDLSVTERLDQIKQSIQSSHALFEIRDYDSALIMFARALLFLQDFLKNLEARGIPIGQISELKSKRVFDDLNQLKDLNLRSTLLEIGLDESQLAFLLSRWMKDIEVIENKVKKLLHIVPPWLKSLKKFIHYLHIVWNRNLGPYRWYISAIALGLLSIFVIRIYDRHRESIKHGLIGEYFSDTNFTQLIYKQRDQAIDFNYGTRGPSRPMRKNRDNFAIRWTGYLEVPKTGRWFFYVRADDGVRIWIDDKLIMQEQNWQATTVKDVQLEQGLHSIKIEYWEFGGLAGIHLNWRHESDFTPSPVEKRFLYPIRDDFKSP
ncbi:MAG: hypothetical protein LHV69_05070 [Elusimicrobia bacterium]|nr:hypothetical protein [Candidatus Obscuribacterium magneticum]